MKENFPYRVPIQWVNGMWRDIDAFLDDNDPIEWDFTSRNWATNQVIFLFRDERHAVAFKLRFDK